MNDIAGRNAPSRVAGFGNVGPDVVVSALLVATLIVVHLADRRFAGDGGQPARPTAGPPSSDIAAAAVAPPVAEALAQPEPRPAEMPKPSQDVATDPEANGQQPPPTRGIITHFEPFVPRIIEEPPPEPKVVEPPEPEPPKLVETPPAPPPPEPKRVEFFETETKAVSVGFVVDCSESMKGEKFRAVCDELARSILDLDRRQKFFVVFFNHQFFPMSGSSAKPRLEPADQVNKRAILDFLRNARAEGGTNPEPALQFMATLAPDVVYLLTDGEFDSLSDATYAQLAKSRIAVHTIGFELGGRSPNLEEIARRTSGTYRAVAKTTATNGLFLANPSAVKAALRSPDKAIRREAALMALLRQLPCVDDVISMLSDADPAIGAGIHDELLIAASGSDFGPANAADVPAAVQRWKLWWSLRSASRAQIVSALAAPEQDTRWVAAARARTAKIEAYDELINMLRTSASPAWNEAHAALVGISGGRDFGPAAGASPADVAAAADGWAAWRKAVREEEARVARETRCKQAADYLRRAKLYDPASRPDMVESLCRDVISRYPDTPAADEARNLLKELESAPAEP